LKYRNLRALAAPLGQLLNSYLNDNQILAEVLVPVPLHRKRLKERGYNQASLLARELGRLVGLPVVEDCITRRQQAPPQARSSSVRERQQNVVNAFAVSKAGLAGKQVLLVDDVATSGATLNACATVLKSAGAASVWGLAVAREI
jgi:ComF family protein